MATKRVRVKAHTRTIRTRKKGSTKKRSSKTPKRSKRTGRFLKT